MTARSDGTAAHTSRSKSAKRVLSPAKGKARPDNRLTLSEFIACIVRLSFLRANPKHGQYDHKGRLVPLPGCLEKMLVNFILPNAKQDTSSLFREELARDADVQAAIDRWRPKGSGLVVWGVAVSEVDECMGSGRK